jgi:hypothetical protein
VYMYIICGAIKQAIIEQFGKKLIEKNALPV